MKITKIEQTDCGFNLKDKKEKHFSEAYIGLIGINRAVDVRFYRTGARTYCCLWIFNPFDSNRHYSGSAYAGGYGYHKASAAFEMALNKAGIKLDEHIGCKGDGAIEEAIYAILLHMRAEHSRHGGIVKFVDNLGLSVQHIYP